MNNLTIFSHPSFGRIRSVLIDEEPYFVGKDIADALGYSNPQKAVRDHVDEEDRGMNELDTPGGRQSLIMINESGLYSLILSSKLPSAKQFKRWVISEVLPAIRKTGSYSIQLKRADLSPTMQTLYLMLDEIANTQRGVAIANETANLALTKADGVKGAFDKMSGTFKAVIDAIKRGVNWRQEINSRIRQIATARNVDYDVIWNEAYDELNIRARCNIQSRLRNCRHRMRKEGASEAQMNKIRKIDIVERDPKLKEIFGIIVAENYIRYCI